MTVVRKKKGAIASFFVFVRGGRLVPVVIGVGALFGVMLSLFVVVASNPILMQENATVPAKRYSALVYALLGVIGMLVIAVGVLAVNVIRRQRAERGVRLRQHAMDQAGVAILIVEDSGMILYANRSAHQLFGCGGDIKGIRFESLPITCKPVPLPDVLNTLIAERVVNLTGQLTGDEHSGMTFEVVGSLVGYGGRCYGCLFLQDRSERERREIDRQQSEKMEALGQLAGGVAHDFNNQLTAIMGYGALLAARLEGTESEKHVERIVTAAERSGVLTRQLLDFSRKNAATSDTVDMHKLIGDVVGLLSRSIDKQILLETDLLADPHVVTGDSAQLQNAVLNLALNSRDAMPAGGKIVFRTSNRELTPVTVIQEGIEATPGAYLRVTVTDNGCGMNEQVLKHIFEPFFTTKTADRGTGLGLSAVFGTVHAHAGTVVVQSEEGVGSSFDIYLPVGASAGDDGNGWMDIQQTVFVVDPSPHVRQEVSAFLEEMGVSTKTFAFGERAVRALLDSEVKPTLVVLGVSCPDLTGLQTFRLMRIHDPGVRVVVMAGDGEGEKAGTFLQAGALGMVDKPLSKDAWAGPLGEWLSIEREFASA